MMYVSRGRWIDLSAIVALAAAAYAVSVHYVRQAVADGLRPAYYQLEFGPAAMLACGYGYVSPAEGELPVLDRFLNVERDSIQCGDLRPAVKLEPLTAMQAYWKYQLWTAAAVWRAIGISWSGLVVLSGVYFAASVVLAYVLARILSGQVASTLVALAVLFSPLHWSQAPHIRDYSKAPFMLGAFILLALVVREPLRPRRVLVLAAGFGLLLGIGYGFRSDILIVVPVFVATVVAFLPGGVLRNLSLKAQTLAVAVAAFGAVAWPLFGSAATGGGLSMSALHGFVSPFDRALEVESGPYEFGYLYNDWYMGAIIRDFGRRQRHVEGPIPLYRTEYNRAGDGVVRELVTTFPADVLARACASVVTIVGLPSSNWTDSHWPPRLSQDGVWQRLFAARAQLVEKVRWLWPAAVILSIVAASLADLRVAAFSAFLLLYFGGYPATQFQERHFFHLDVVPPLAVAALAAQIQRALARGSAGARAALASAAVLRCAVFSVVLLFLMVTPLVAARAYQTSHLRATLTDRLTAPSEPIRLTEEPLEETRVIFETDSLPADASAHAHPGSVTSEYLLARLGGERCDALRLPVTLRYRAPYPLGDFSRMLAITMPARSGAQVKLLAPVFYRYQLASDAIDRTDSAYQFRGVETSVADTGCVQGIDRIVDTTRFPLLLSAALTPEWQQAELYQTIAAVERRSPRPDALTTVTAPDDLRVSRAQMSSPLEPLAVAARADALATMTGGGWRMDGAGGIGAARGPFAYLLTTSTRPAHAGDQLIVEGTMRSGGLSIGLIRDDKWLIHTPVVVRGRFLAVVQAPSDGSVSAVIANNLPSGSASNQFDITRAGWKAATQAW